MILFSTIYQQFVLSSKSRWRSMTTKAELVRDMRLNKRLTQTDVAAKMKISQASYSLIELGEKPRAVEEAVETINRMRMRTDRTDGGTEKAGRQK